MDAIAPMTGNTAHGASNAAVHHLASIHARALAWFGEQVSLRRVLVGVCPTSSQISS